MTAKMLRLLSLPAVLFVLAVFATGCNTIEGMGEDVSAAGDKIDETAEDAKN